MVDMLKIRSSNFKGNNNLVIPIIFFVVVVEIIALLIPVILNIEFSSDQVEEVQEEVAAQVETPPPFNIMQEINACKSGAKSYDETLNRQINTTDSIVATASVSSFGQKKASDNFIKALNDEALNFEKTYGEPLSFVMYDLNSDSGVSYCLDMQTYYASCIKLPYVFSVIESDPAVFADRRDDIYNILQFSDNVAYESLRDTYGNVNLTNWQNRLRILNDVSEYYYPSYATARDLLKLWFKSFYVLNTHPNQIELDSFTQNSLESSISNMLSSKYCVNSKAGWFDCPEISDSGYYFNGITNDAGVVYAGDNPYLVVVLSEVPQNKEAVSKIISAIDSLHDDLVKVVN